MKNKFRFLFFNRELTLCVAVLLVTMCTKSDAMSFQCTFSTYESSYEYYGPFYVCSVAPLGNSNKIGKLEAVTGVHLAGKSNANVQMITIIDPSMIEAPIDLYRFFPNLEIILLQRTNIAYLSKEHLYGLSKLFLVTYADNPNLTAIGEDFFIYQPDQILRIQISDNPIATLGPRFFSRMSELETLCISVVPCGYDICVSKNKMRVAAEIPKLIEGCSLIIPKVTVQEQFRNVTATCSDDKIKSIVTIMTSEDGTC